MSNSPSQHPGRALPPPPGQRPPGAPSSGPRPAVVVGIAAAIVLVLLLVVVVAGSGGDGDDTATDERTDERTDAGSGTVESPELEEAPRYAEVTVEGTSLRVLPAAGADPMIGEPMPVLSGTGFDGQPLTIPATGRPTMIMFVAHWCPHCQEEVPVVQDWVDDGGLPAEVDLATVSTAVDDRRPNYPPAAWLDGEGWTAPVLADDPGSTASRAAGLTAYPFFVAVDADGNVVDRVSGELTPDQLDELATELARDGS